jgi:hypothetical protein
MSQQCIVLPLLQLYNKEQLLNQYVEHFQKTITKCKCPEHINENPINLPTISDLHQQLILVLNDLLDFGFDHINDESAKKLISFIQRDCLSESPTSLFSLLDNLEKKYG